MAVFSLPEQNNPAPKARKKLRKRAKHIPLPVHSNADLLSVAQKRKQDAMDLARLIYDIYNEEKDTKL